MVVQEASPARHQGHPRFLQERDVKGIEPINLIADVVQQHRRVLLRRGHGDSIAGRIRQLLLHLGSVHQQLLGHATADHAGPADPVPLHNRHPRPMAGRPLRSSKPPGAGPKHDQIKGSGIKVLRHGRQSQSHLNWGIVHVLQRTVRSTTVLTMAIANAASLRMGIDVIGGL